MGKVDINVTNPMPWFYLIQFRNDTRSGGGGGGIGGGGGGGGAASAAGQLLSSLGKSLLLLNPGSPELVLPLLFT